MNTMNKRCDDEFESFIGSRKSAPGGEMRFLLKKPRRDLESRCCESWRGESFASLRFDGKGPSDWLFGIKRLPHPVDPRRVVEGTLTPGVDRSVGHVTYTETN